MSEAVQLSVISLLSTFLTGSVIAVIGVWVYRRQKRADADVIAEVDERAELSGIRKAREDRVVYLEALLETKNTIIMTQQEVIAGLREDRARLLAGKPAQSAEGNYGD